MFSDQFEELYKNCEEFGFDKRITAEMCWNEGYQLGRKRWYWGPHWWVEFHGWLKSPKRWLAKLAVKSPSAK